MHEFKKNMESISQRVFRDVNQSEVEIWKKDRNHTNKCIWGNSTRHNTNIEL